MNLTGKEKRALRARGHHLEVVVQVGGAGVTEGVVGAVSQALEDHELIKIRLAEERGDREAAVESLASQTGAQVVQILGRTALLFKKRAPRPPAPRPTRAPGPRPRRAAAGERPARTSRPRPEGEGERPARGPARAARRVWRQAPGGVGKGSASKGSASAGGGAPRRPGSAPRGRPPRGQGAGPRRR